MKFASILIPTLVLSALCYAFIRLAIDVSLDGAQMSVVVIAAFALVMLVRWLSSRLFRPANSREDGDERDVESP
jgi:hypothetical protein